MSNSPVSQRSWWHLVQPKSSARTATLPPHLPKTEGGTLLRPPPADSRSRRLQILFVYGTGLAIGLHIALIHLYLWRSPGAFFFFLGATVVYATLMLGLWNWLLPRFAERPFLQRLTAQLLASVAAFAALSFVTVEANSFLFGGHSILNPYDGPDRTITIPAAAMRGAPIIYALMPIVPSAILCVVGFNLHWWRILLMQARERELQELAASAQLAALRAQIHPHFFFNSLNSIAQLIHADPDKAETCVERLGEIFRYLLQRSDREFVPLADELRLVEAYLDIEHARFGDDLRVEWRVEEQARSAQIPAFVLQPLVENAVKHGVSQKIGGGTLQIAAQVRDGHLLLRVADTGNGVQDSGAVFDSGIGLRSVRDRLLRIYGQRAALAFDSQPERGTCVTVQIPFQTSEDTT